MLAAVGTDKNGILRCACLLYTSLPDLPDREEIPQGFAHLPVVDIQKRIVQPVARKGPAVAAFTLSDLILMMWKNQILSSGVDVYLLSQIFLRHL